MRVDADFKPSNVERAHVKLLKTGKVDLTEDTLTSADKTTTFRKKDFR